MTKVAIVYYSSTGHGTRMAEELRKGAEEAGAEVRVRHVRETVPPEQFADNPAWKAHYEATKDLPEAQPEDVAWADGVIFGSPTRYSSVASQFQTFIDSLGGLWGEGKLQDKTYTCFTSSMTTHGGQEATLHVMMRFAVHFGGILVPPGYTDPVKFEEGNPYGTSHTTGPENTDELDEATVKALHHQARRLVQVTDKLVAAG